MPYKSRSQQRLFHHLVAQGKLAPEVAEEYDTASKGKKLPQHVKRKAFGGEVEGKAGTRCPACDYPLDAIPVALDAGEGCPRCGYGDAKDVPHKAHGGEIMDVTAYRARGGTTPEMSKEYQKKYQSIVNKYGVNESEGLERRKQRELDLLAKKYPFTADSTPVPIYTRSGIRSEQSVRSDENPTRFAMFGDYEKRFAKAKESPLWRLREELATRGTRSGEQDDLVAGYITDSQENIGKYVMPRRAHGGEVCEHCGNDMLADLKELYPSKKRRALDDGKIHAFGQMFARALKTGRK